MRQPARGGSVIRDETPLIPAIGVERIGSMALCSFSSDERTPGRDQLFRWSEDIERWRPEASMTQYAASTARSLR
jgi:hypothetical protein